ncbi:MAG: hypothetical protein ABIG39_06250, partial [Candidatus Micrarchaeota archaeon]
KDLCYSKVAKLLGDSSLCEEIGQEIYKELCLSHFQKTESKEWDYTGKLSESSIRVNYPPAIKQSCPYIIIDLKGKFISVCGEDISKLEEHTMVRVKGELKKESFTCENCVILEKEYEHIEVSEFEVVEWNDIEQSCNSAKMNYSACSEDERCEMCNDVLVTSSEWCHAKEYCEELDSAFNSEFGS